MGIFFESGKNKRIRQRKERDGFRLSSAVPKIHPPPLRLLGYGKPLPKNQTAPIEMVISDLFRIPKRLSAFVSLFYIFPKPKGKL